MNGLCFFSEIIVFQPVNLTRNSFYPPPCIITSQKHPSLQGSEDLKETSRPNSMASNASFHSTQDEFESLPQVPSTTQVEREDGSGGVSVRQEEEESGGGRGGSKEEIRLLRQALESVQTKLLETRKENRSLQAQLKPERGSEREEYESVREKGREEELMESLAELQAKLTDTQERYHQAVEEVEELRVQIGRAGGELMEKQEVQRRTSSTLENEIKQLKAQLDQSGSEQEKAAQRIRLLEEALRRVEEERRRVEEKEQRTAQTEELYKLEQEEIRMLQVDMGLFFSLNFCMTERGTPIYTSKSNVSLQVLGRTTAYNAFRGLWLERSKFSRRL